MLLLLIGLTGSYTLSAQQPAFPGAEGAGIYTTGGRGTAATATTVFEVTNLNDDNNPGSLRYALQATATYRTIVFRVSGTIHLLSKLNIRGNTTIAGQTAPGDGICTADYPVVISGDNVIIRYMRFRMGDKNQNKGMVDGSGGDDALGALGANNIIIDHCSVSWSSDEALTIYRGDNLTIQWCFINEPLNYSYHFETGDTDYELHGYGGIWGAKRGSFHHNLFAHCRNRNPRFAGISTYSPATVGVENADFRNNVLYNWGINTVYAGEGGNYNVVNNYYKYGPSTSSGVRYRICNPGNTSTIPFGKWFVNGNYVDGSATNTANNWSGVVMSTGVAADTVQSKVTTAFDLGYPINTQSATDAYDSVLKKGGCSLPNRDTLDQRIVNDVRNRTGRIIDVQGGYPHGTAYSLTVNAWPTLLSTAAPADTDHDGMPDSWETANGLNPNDASDRNGYASNGYTNLENYLNNIVNTNPAIAASGTLSSFSQTPGSPSAAQTFTVSGSNLTGDITLTPPAGYELSLNGTTWSTTAITIAQSGGAVASTTVSVRLNAATQGAYTGNIIAASAGALSISIAVSGVTGTVTPPATNGQNIGSFPDMDGGFEKQTIGSYTTISAHTSTTKWEASSNFNIADTGARTGALMLHWTGASTSTKYLVSPVLTAPTLQQSTSYVVQFWYKKQASAGAGKLFLNGYAFITGGISGSSGTGTTEIDSMLHSDPTNGWVMFKGIVTTQNVTATSTYGGIKVINPQTPFFDIDDYVVYPGSAFDVTPPGAATGPVASGSAANNTITVSWAAPASGVDGGGYVVVRSLSATPPTPNANGVYVAGNSMGAGNTVVYTGTANSFIDNGSVAALSPSVTYYYYIFTADKAFNYSAALPVTGSITGGGTPAVNASGTLSGFSQNLGTPSASRSFTVSGANLTGNITVTAPANFELSIDDNTWASALTLVPTAGAVNDAVFARLNASSAGNYSGNITIASAGAANATLAVGGTTTTVSSPPAGINVTVAQDGSGNYTSIQAAVTAAPTGATAPYRIYIKKGKYVETVIIPSNKPFIQLMGESVSETILSYDNYSGKAKPTTGTYGTSDCATLIINAPDVMLMNLSIENAVAYGIDANAPVPAPGDGPQAVAVYTTSDRVVMYNCRMNGGQDTYYGGNNPATRCYLKNCYIDGNTDFLFGSSTIIFDTCIIYPRTRLDAGNGGYVTAVNTKAVSGYGYVFRDCKLTKNRGTTFYTLGRPWQNDAGTADASKSRNKAVFLNTLMGSSISAAGWSTWDAGTNTSYITYGEYNSKKYDGVTATDISGRVSWSQQLSAAQAAKYYNNDTVFVNANTPAMTTWNPYAAWPELAAGFRPELVVSNLVAKKGSPTVSTSTINWNLSWPMPGIKCELYRTNDKITYTLVSTQTSTEDSACNFTFSENIPPPGQTWWYIVKASKPGYTSITSDTTSVVSTPTITATGTLNAFLQGLGAPSATQTYLVSGANLTTGITITPPAGYEVSADNTNWYSSSSPLVLAQSSGVVANTYISVRLNATSAGAYSGNIVHVSTGAVTVNVAVSGTVQTAPLSVGVVLEQWPLTINNADSAAVRDPAVKPTTPVFSRLFLSDGVAVPQVPAYSGLHGQAFGVTADGYWSTAQGGPGSTMSRLYYEQFTLVADSAHSIRVDSILLSTAFHNTSSGTRMALVYSKTGFRTDSTEVTAVSLGGVGLTPAASGNFTNTFPINNQTAGTTDRYGALLNGSAGVNLNAKDTLTFRIYHCTGSGSNGRYAKLANVVVKGLPGIAAVAGDYRSVKSGEWSDTATWRRYDGANWVAGATLTDYPAYDGGVNTAIVQNGHTVTYTQSFTKGFGYIQKTVINKGGQLLVGAGKTLSVAGIDGQIVILQVDGTLTNLGTIGSNGKVLYKITGNYVNTGAMGFNTGDSVAVSAGGVYQHDNNGSMPARVSFADSSTLLVTGIKTSQTNLFTTPAKLVNLVWNCPAEQNYFALRNTIASVSGNVTIQSTGSTYICLSQGTATLPIGGNYTQTGGNVYFNESASGIVDSLTIGGDFNVSGGSFNANMKNTDPLYLKLNGSNKTFALAGGSLANTQVWVNGQYNLSGNLSLPTAGFGLLVKGTLNTGTNVVSGSGNISIADAANVSFGAAMGIDGNFTNSGTKQYSTNANYTFSGTVAQTTGATMPAGAHTLIINNTANVTLSAPFTAGILNFAAGKLLLGNNTLTDTTITGVSATSYVVTNGTGMLRQVLTLSSGAVSYPIGSSVTSYTPATLNNTGATDKFSVGVKDNIDYAVGDNTKVVKKQWTITPDNAAGSPNLSVALSWLTTDQGANFNAVLPLVHNYQSGAWKSNTTTVAGNGSAATPYTATAAGITQTGVFIIGNTGTSVAQLNATGTLTAFTQSVGTPSATQTYTVSGQFLGGNMTITPPAGYELSATGAAPWSTNASPLVLTPASGSIANTTIAVRLNAGAAGSFAGNITHSSTGAATVNIAVTGTATNLPAISVSGSMAAFSQTLGAPSQAQLLGIQGSYLSGTVTITPPAGFEVSLNNSTAWISDTSKLVLTPAAGVVNVPDIRIRLNARTIGAHSGAITIQSNGAVARTVNVSGYTYGYLSVGPNPARNALTIYHPALYTVGFISIYDMHGVKYGGTWQTQPGTASTTINISALPAGVYMIEFRRLDERTILRFVKQ